MHDETMQIWCSHRGASAVVLRSEAATQVNVLVILWFNYAICKAKYTVIYSAMWNCLEIITFSDKSRSVVIPCDGDNTLSKQVPLTTNTSHRT